MVRALAGPALCILYLNSGAELPVHPVVLLDSLKNCLLEKRASIMKGARLRSKTCHPRTGFAKLHSEFFGRYWNCASYRGQRPRRPAERGLLGYARQRNDRGLRFSLGDQVIEDQVGPSHASPCDVPVPCAVKQVQHWVLLVA